MLQQDTDLRIIIVDDSKDDHFFIKSALSQYKNIKFKSLNNEAELLNYLLKRGVYENSNKELPDIVILDINIPKPDNFEAFEILDVYPQFERINFVVLTNTLIHRSKHFRNLKLDCYQKPFALENFRDILVDTIKKHQKTISSTI